MPRYEDDDGRLRCLDCDAYVATGKPCAQCANRKAASAAATQEIVDEAVREEQRQQRSAAVRSWRMRQLRRYTDQVLALRGAKRIEFMEARPISELFR